MILCEPWRRQWRHRGGRHRQRTFIALADLYKGIERSFRPKFQREFPRNSGAEEVQINLLICQNKLLKVD
jgi:hypothetical protein